jgi:hypothetical protein
MVSAQVLTQAVLGKRNARRSISALWHFPGCGTPRIGVNRPDACTTTAPSAGSLVTPVEGWHMARFRVGAPSPRAHVSARRRGPPRGRTRRSARAGLVFVVMVGSAYTAASRSPWPVILASAGLIVVFGAYGLAWLTGYKRHRREHGYTRAMPWCWWCRRMARRAYRRVKALETRDRLGIR